MLELGTLKLKYFQLVARAHRRRAGGERDRAGPVLRQEHREGVRLQLHPDLDSLPRRSPEHLPRRSGGRERDLDLASRESGEE